MTEKIITNTDQCGQCRFYVPVGKDHGQCHCHAPSPAIIMSSQNGMPEIWWPEVGEAEFCGDYCRRS